MPRFSSVTCGTEAGPVRTSQESCPRLGGQGGCDGGVCVSCSLCIRARALGLQKGRQAFRRVAARPARPASGRVGTLVRFPLRWVLLLVFSRVHAPPCCLCPPRAPRPRLGTLLGTRLLPKGCRGVAPEPGREHSPPRSWPWRVQFGRDLGGLKMMKHLHTLCVGALKFTL